jgi:hypothetical protein
MTNLSRPHLKRAIVNRLDAAAKEHRIGHQDAYANRYSMRSDDNVPVELMFEKDPETESYLWVLAAQVANLSDGTIPAEFYSKDDLYNVPAKNGGMQYGRHSALEKMTWLGKANLVRFTLGSVADLDQILSVLMREPRRGHAGI